MVLDLAPMKILLAHILLDFFYIKILLPRLKKIRQESKLRFLEQS